jgi:hypothetical protein
VLLVDYFDITILYYENEVILIGGKMRLEAKLQVDGLE